ncbi:MAG TPA: hypothetical protein VFL47_00270, partial [Flavisolibacter sp.]|nr:hypothetical protein [Flavisolibacter sp.]
DLAKMDPFANKPNRYEVGLFNQSAPAKKTVYRWEELYLQYNLPKGFVRLGGQLINTPFINPQDGRMRPTFVSGIYTKQIFESTQVEGGWIAGVLPRSIDRWYSVGPSIGLYPQGVNTDGTPSNYAGRLSSRGIFLAGVSRNVWPGIKLKLWEQFVENIFNAALVQIDAEKTGTNKTEYLVSLQYIHQVRVGDGGRCETSKGYFQSDAPAQAISATAGVKPGRLDASISYTRILKDARFLTPREWGREPFFTFMPRERNEGIGDVQALVFRTAYGFPKAGLKAALQAGHFALPDVKDVALNKYGMPSYDQLNAELRYTPAFAPKFDVQALYVYKANRGDIYQNPVYVFNKVNLSHYNLVINYTW